MELSPGLKLTSAGSTAQFIVIRGSGPAELTLAGLPLTQDGAGDAAAATPEGDLQVGKRYADADGSIELLCTQSGPGPLALDGVVLTAAQAKSLPSSD